jgi:hypothetical protein
MVNLMQNINLIFTLFQRMLQFKIERVCDLEFLLYLNFI